MLGIMISKLYIEFCFLRSRSLNVNCACLRKTNAVVPDRLPRSLQSPPCNGGRLPLFLSRRMLCRPRTRTPVTLTLTLPCWDPAVMVTRRMLPCAHVHRSRDIKQMIMRACASYSYSYSDAIRTRALDQNQVLSTRTHARAIATSHSRSISHMHIYDIQTNIKLYSYF
jgi:hypothetical protein